MEEHPLLRWWHSLAVEKQHAEAQRAGYTLDDLHRVSDALEQSGLTRERAETAAIMVILQKSAGASSKLEE